MSRIDESTDRPLGGGAHHDADAEHVDPAERGSVGTDDPATDGSALTDDPTDDTAAHADEPSGARQDTAAARLGADPETPPAEQVQERPEALIPEDRSADYRARWDVVKGQFVDDPRSAVRGANTMVGEILDELEELFRRQRSELEQGLDDDETSTEDLRLALRRYHSFFDRLLSL